MKRRLLLLLSLLAPTLDAWPQGFRPEKPLRMLVGFAPGGLTDLVARTLSVQLSAVLGQTVVVENRGGASGRIAIDLLAAAPADGYTLLFAGPEVVLSRRRRDLLPVAQVATVPLAFVARAGATIQSLRNQGEKSVYLGGFHAPLLLRQLKLGRVVVTDQSSAQAALADLRDRKLDAAIVPYPTVRDEVRKGGLTILEVAGASNHPELRDRPAMQLSQPEAGQYFLGVFAPIGMPEPIRLSLSQSIEKAASHPDFRSSLENGGMVAAPMQSLAFARRVEDQYGVTPDPCKKKDTCEKDKECPRPCPES